MTLKQRFLRWISLFLPWKIPAGVSTTVIEESEHPTSRLVKNAPKYQTKHGQYCVYIGIRRGDKGQIMHELLHIESNTTFAASDALFRALFEKAPNKPLER